MTAQTQHPVIVQQTLDRARARWRRYRAIRGVPPRRLDESEPHYLADRDLLFFHGTMRRIGSQIAGLKAMQPSIEAAHRMRSALASDERRQLDAQLDTALDHLAAQSAQAHALIEGLCDGLAAGYDRHDMLHLQLGTLLGPPKTPASECGAIALSTDDGILVGQNLDLGVTNNVALAYILPDDAPARLCHINLEYGVVTVGINEFGVLYGGGSVNVDRRFRPTLRAVYAAFLSELLLGECHNSAEAPDVLERAAPIGPSHDGFSLLVADSQTNVTRVEGTGSVVVAKAAPAPVVVAANDFALEDTAELNRKGDPAATNIQENSLARERRAREFFNHATPTRETLAEFMRTGRGKGHWCRRARWPDVGWTTASYLFDPVNAWIDYWCGIGPARPSHRSLDMSFLFERRALA